MRKFIRLGLLSAFAVSIIAATAIPAQANAASYVALGDSYSSGTGTGEYFDDDCQRSDHSYPAQLAVEQGLDLNLAACSGAKIADVQNNQLAQLNDTTSLVTMSVGGNDTGWGDIVTSCARPWPWTCWDDIDNAEAFVRDELPGQLDGLYNQITAAAPNAQVIIVGYPRLFNGEECNVVTRISPEEQERLNNAADLLSTTIGGVAANHGFSYVDVTGTFDGHAVCDDEEWLNGLSNPISESYHPNQLGHDAYTTDVAAAL